MDGPPRLIVVRRDQPETFQMIQSSMDRWPPRSVVILDRRERERRVLQLQVTIERRSHQRRAEPEAGWYSHGFIVVAPDRLPLLVATGLRVVRDLPGWPPDGLPRRHAGVLHSVDWRVDLLGGRDLRVTVEHEGRLLTALYPGRSDVRGRLETPVLQQLYTVLSRSTGKPMERIADMPLT